MTKASRRVQSCTRLIPFTVICKELDLFRIEDDTPCIMHPSCSYKQVDAAVDVIGSDSKNFRFYIIYLDAILLN